MKTFPAKDYELIISYLDQSMDSKIKEIFEIRLDEEPELFEEMLQVEMTLQMTKDIYFQNELEKILSGEEEKQNEPKVIPIGQRPSIWLMAASITVLLGIGGRYLYLEYSKKTDIGQEISQNEVLPKDSTKSIPGPQTGPSTDFMANTLIAEDLELNNIPKSLEGEAQAIAIDIKRKKGIVSLEKLAPLSPTPDNKKPGEILLGSSPEEIATKPGLSSREEAYRKLLLGVGYLKEGQTQDALKVLNQVKEASLAQDVHWYKALALIKTGMNVQARAELEKITDERYLTDAQELLSNLPQ